MSKTHQDHSGRFASTLIALSPNLIMFADPQSPPRDTGIFYTPRHRDNICVLFSSNHLQRGNSFRMQRLYILLDFIQLH